MNSVRYTPWGLVSVNQRVRQQHERCRGVPVMAAAASGRQLGRRCASSQPALDVQPWPPRWWPPPAPIPPGDLSSAENSQRHRTLRVSAPKLATPPGAAPGVRRPEGPERVRLASGCSDPPQPLPIFISFLFNFIHQSLIWELVEKTVMYRVHQVRLKLRCPRGSR